MSGTRNRIAVLLLALAASGAGPLARAVNGPLQRRGAAPRHTSVVNAVGFLLEVPGSLLVGGAPGDRRRSDSPTVVFIGNMVFYLALFGALLAAWRLARLSAPSLTVPPTAEPLDARSVSGSAPVSRRRFLRLGMAAAGGGAASLGGYAMVVEPRWVEVTRRTFPVAGLPPELDGVRLVQLTDIHLGPWNSEDFVGDVVRRANALDADIFVLTGDFVHKSSAYAGPVAERLSELRPRIGMAAVLGNHDWWEGAQSVRRELVARGIPVIDNDRLFVTQERRIARTADRGLCIAGLGDLREDRCLFDRALGDVPADVPRIVLSHNPDAAEEEALLRGGHRIDLMLSGHTHGGQIGVPHIRPTYVPSRFGAKYASGLVRGPKCWVYVSRGIGVTVLPLRFLVRPEIAAIDLVRPA